MIVKEKSTFFNGEYYINKKGDVITAIIYKQDKHWTLWGGLYIVELKTFIDELRKGYGINEGYSEYPLTLDEAIENANQD